MIPAEAVGAAVDALIASKLGDHPGINGEEFVEAARAALEAAAPYMMADTTPKPPKHQCEPWQIQVNGSGTFRYCAACGEPAP